MQIKKFSWLFTIAIAMVLAINVLVTACGGGTTTSGGPQKLVMGTSADYPPYEYRDTASGKTEIIGFDVAIANYITKQLNYTLEIKDMDFNGLLPALQAKRVDFVMAGMTPTDERKKSVDFTDIYFEAKNTIIAPKGSNLKKVEDLVGKGVGVQLGSIQEGDMKKTAEKIKGINLKSLNKIGDLIQEIKSKRLEAAIVEDTVAKGYVAANPDLEFNVIPSDGPSGSAIAFPKGSTLVKPFNDALTQMKQKGEIETLVKKWFDKQA
jgi:polar amino acid transport system substrate-binding protein